MKTEQNIADNGSESPEKLKMPPHESDYQLNSINLEGFVRSLVHDDRFHYLIIEHHTAIGNPSDKVTPVRCRLTPMQTKIAMEKLAPGKEVRITGYLIWDPNGLHVGCSKMSYRTFRP